MRSFSTISANSVTDRVLLSDRSSVEKVKEQDAIARRSIVFIDAAVDDPITLINAVTPVTKVVVLDPRQNGIDQITTVLREAFLKDQVALSTIHILSHGSPGCLRLGNSELSLDTLADYSTDIRSWFVPGAESSDALSSDAFSSNNSSLMLYGCNVAAGDAGSEFVEKLYQIVQRPVYATRTKTGNVSKGGNWQLEVALGANGTLRPPMPFVLEVLATYQGLFLDAELFKDINSGLASSSPAGFTEFDGKLFFSAQSDSTGAELWVSDGTAIGTQLLKNIEPGSQDSDPRNFTEVGAQLFFSADDGTHGRELWVSDGTADGTQLVEDINPDAGSYLTSFTEVGGQLFFKANDGVSGGELWVSDGTAAGTQLVKDINPGLDGSELKNFTKFGERLLFSADDGTHGRELWASDGTAAGTQLVKDINFGVESSYPKYLTEAGGKLFFSAKDDTNGTELWVSDGTATGTQLVKDIKPDLVGIIGSYPRDLTEFDGQLFFRAYDSFIGYELWASDGTTAGTQIVKDINLNLKGLRGSYPSELTEVDGQLFFRGYSSDTGSELWVSDGTTAGVQLVKDINPGIDDSDPRYLIKFDGQLFFSADDGTTGKALWTSDGTAAGTQLVKDIDPGTSGEGPHNFIEFDGQLFFTANDGIHGDELWVLSGVLDPTVIDTVLGDEYNNFLQGTSKDNLINGLDGDDILVGKAGNDTLYGGGGNDQLKGGSGSDILYGDDGDDRLQGRGGSDTLYGGSGDDYLSGDGGDDILSGGAGSDILRGDGGRDTFVLEVNKGKDTIRDFTKGMDYLGLSDGLSFADLDIIGQGKNTLINYNGSTLASLSNVSASTIGVEDFKFL